MAAIVEVAVEAKESQDALLELIRAQSNPERVARRTQQILEYMRSNAGSEQTQVIALALRDASDKTLFALLQQAKQKQSVEGSIFGRKKIVLTD